MPSQPGSAPVAFLSYADADHARHGASLAELAAALEDDIRTRTGHSSFRVFCDRRDPRWGELWHERIAGTADPANAAAILIAVMTPAFFRNAQCRHELERFLQIERQLARPDLVVAVRWSKELDLIAGGTTDLLARAVAHRVSMHWPPPGGESPAAVPVERWAADLAGRISVPLDALVRPAILWPDGIAHYDIAHDDNAHDDNAHYDITPDDSAHHDITLDDSAYHDDTARYDIIGRYDGISRYNSDTAQRSGVVQVPRQLQPGQTIPLPIQPRPSRVSVPQQAPAPTVSAPPTSDPTAPARVAPAGVAQAPPVRRGMQPQSPLSQAGGERGSRHPVYRPIVTSNDLSMKAFSATRLRTGYTMVGVDAFLDRTAAELHRLHTLVLSVESGYRPDPSELVLRVTPTEISSTTFNPTRFLSGYCEQEVDDFLSVVAREFANLQKFMSAVSSAGRTGVRGLSYHAGITGPEVAGKLFTRTQLGVGYKVDQVNDFLDRVAQDLAVMHALVKSTGDGRQRDPGSFPACLAPADISAVKFDTTRFYGGYREYEVDDFLDFLEREFARVQDYLVVRSD
ncbi:MULTISPECIES: DivIVA domain-containing protein [unclassified Frankia]|uniref:DivIVA domain-containing protein n=1 Tax=unclassified Frankia TaxID=2632575 RepID=UPI002AD49AEE|nr:MULTISPECIES: DivIVA domain-containing protein [unclassified Frankia]